MLQFNKVCLFIHLGIKYFEVSFEFLFKLSIEKISPPDVTIFLKNILPYLFLPSLKLLVAAS